MSEIDPIKKGKNDWLNYQGKKDEIKENKKLDDAHNQKVAEQLAKKHPERLERKPFPKNNPHGGFTLG